jgi:hypothetical protein
MKREMRLVKVVARLLKACEMRNTGPWVLEGLESGGRVRVCPSGTDSEDLDARAQRTSE